MCLSVKRANARTRCSQSSKTARAGLGSDVRVTHVSLNDGTVEGIAGPDFASVQFHPEAAPGPLDALPFFDRIAERCQSART